MEFLHKLCKNSKIFKNWSFRHETYVKNMKWVINDWTKLEIQIKPDFGMKMNRNEWDESFGRICSYKFHINVCECILHVQFGWFATCHCIHLKHLFQKILNFSAKLHELLYRSKHIYKLRSSVSNSTETTVFKDHTYLGSILNKTPRTQMLHVFG